MTLLVVLYPIWLNTAVPIVLTLLKTQDRKVKQLPSPGKQEKAVMKLI